MSIKLYQERFEKLANRTKGLTEEFFVSCFVSGLKDEIKTEVQIFQPTTISHAIGLARLQEESIETLSRRNKTPQRSSNNNWSFPFPTLSLPKPLFFSGPKSNTKTPPPVPTDSKYQPTTSSNSTLTSPTNFSIKRLTSKEMEARREKRALLQL